ncbi:MAG TPA: GtrA family protein, partial [Candidatus Paceibacterota bacterium]|nr:GtrA family protein [Candidatus Paceibacterota bacterium]
FVLPILWILGVLLGYFLGQWFKFFEQFGKFSVIGVSNTTVDFGVLNLFIASTGYTSGGGYALIKVFAFMAALVCSYLLNKFWTFNGLIGGKGEFAKFVAVTLGSFAVNLGVSWAVATFVSPVLGLSLTQWANVANAAGVAVGLIFNFIGFKFIVFKFEVIDVGL